MSAGVAYHTSKSDSTRSASNFSKEVVDRAVSTIQKRVSEQRNNKQVYEIEEINKHGFDNAKGDGNVSGIYRWLDKHYQAQVYNYGKRVMYEFIIPEPAAFIKDVMQRNQLSLVLPKKPKKPTKPIISLDTKLKTDPLLPDETSWEKYLETYGKEYNLDLSNITALEDPADVICPCDGQPSGNFAQRFVAPIDEGCVLNNVNISGSATAGGSDAIMTVVFGINKIIKRPASVGNNLIFDFNLPDNYLLNKDKEIIVDVSGFGVVNYAIHVVGKPKRTGSAISNWKQKAFGLIMEGYNKKMAEWNGEMAEWQAKKDAYDAKQEAVASGYNPGINKEIINTELKKHCITMMTKQFASEQYQNEDRPFDALGERGDSIEVPMEEENENEEENPSGNANPKTKIIPHSIPAIDVLKAKEVGKLIQFLEQAFEWPQISYILYPYFYGEYPKFWYESQQYFNDIDPLYSKFLQAGSVRVMIAVHPAYEDAVLQFMCTQEPWYGGDAPAVNDALYIPIYAELRAQQDDLNGAVPYGEPWKVVVPTSLIYLQPTSELPTFPIPAPGKKS